MESDGNNVEPNPKIKIIDVNIFKKTNIFPSVIPKKKYQIQER